MFNRNFQRSFILLAVMFIIVSCAEMKQAGKDIGHATRDATRAIGHGTRDAVKAVGRGVKRVVNDEDKDKEKK